MKFKVSTNEEVLNDFGGSSYIAKSGIYDVTIKFASLDVSKGGAESVNFNLDYNGNDQTIYGPYVTAKNGDPLDVGLKLVNSLAVIAGMDQGQDLSIEEEDHTVGKDKKTQSFAVITDFSDMPIKIQLQEEYSVNPVKNEIQKRMVIKNFFRASDGASAAECVSGKDVGKRLSTVEERYADKVTYKDDLTPEAVEAWRESKKNGSTPSKPAPTTAKPAGSLFK